MCSTWRTAASTPQTLLVGSICGLPAAISCPHRDTGVRCSVLGPFLWPFYQHTQRIIRGFAIMRCINLLLTLTLGKKMMTMMKRTRRFDGVPKVTAATCVSPSPTLMLVTRSTMKSTIKSQLSTLSSFNAFVSLMLPEQSTTSARSTWHSEAQWPATDWNTFVKLELDFNEEFQINFNCSYFAEIVNKTRTIQLHFRQTNYSNFFLTEPRDVAVNVPTKFSEECSIV